MWKAASMVVQHTRPQVAIASRTLPLQSRKILNYKSLEEPDNGDFVDG